MSTWAVWSSVDKPCNVCLLVDVVFIGYLSCVLCSQSCHRGVG